MRVAALYDIHGNLVALEAVLAELERLAPDHILVGGDVALGPMPRETLERLATLGDRVTYIRGNCDREMATPTEAFKSGAWGMRTAWAASRCTPAQVALLAGLPTTATLAIDGLGPVLFCHGSPRHDDEILTKLSPDERLRAVLSGKEPPVIVSGHTHVQYERDALGRRWINPGSVGMAYEREAVACWAMFGPEVSLRRTPYDVERAIRDVRASGFPDPEEFVEKYLRQRPDPDEASAFFENMAATAPQGS
jgi:predicted phosphodiesterase